MVERQHDGPLPPAHPVADGRPPLPDGQGVPQPPVPLPPRELRRAQLVAIAAAVVVLAAIVLGEVLR